MSRRVMSSLVVVVGALALGGCGPMPWDSARTREARSIEANQKQLIDSYPVPRFDTSLERDILVQLYTLRNKARNTHSVFMSDGTATPFYDCPSIGYPIANDVRLTAGSTTDGNPQAEPNGVYPADSSWGTWVMCVEGDGSLTPVYNESNTLTFPFPVSVDYATGRITKVGDPSMVISLTNPEQ